MLSLGNLGKAKEAFDIFKSVTDAAEDLTRLDGVSDVIAGIMSGVNLDDAIRSFRKLGLEGDSLKKILLDCDFEISAVEKGLAKASSSGTKGVGKLGSAFSGLAAKIGISTTALGALTGVLAVVGVAFAAFKVYDSYIQRCVDSAKEAGSAWSSFNASSESQIDRIKELNDALKSGTLTEAESYNAKSELYSIQKSLIDSYGDQAKAIDLVNGKIDEEIANIRRLNADQADLFINKNYSGIEKAISEMEKVRRYDIGRISYNPEGAVEQTIDGVLEKYKDYLKLIDSGDGLTNTIYFYGNAEDADRVLNDLMTDLRDAASQFDNPALVDGFINGVSKALNSTGEVLENYQQIYEQQKQAALVADKTNYGFGDESKTAAAWMADLESAVNDYNAALDSGNTDKISSAADEFSRVKKAVDSAVNAESGKSLSMYNEQIKEVIDNLNSAEIAKRDFTKSLANNKDAEALKKSGLTDIDFKAMLDTAGIQPYEAAFRNLVNLASEYGIELDELTSILVDLGYISGNVAGAIQDSADDAVKSYSDMTTAVSDLKAELGTINGAISEQGYSGSLSVDTYNSLIAISKDYAACVEYQNGALQLNAEKANILFEAKSKLQKAEIELQKVTEAAKWKENADEIARLTKEYDGLDPVIKDQIDNLKKENEGIEANLVGYDLQIAAIEELTSAYGRWKAVSESDNSDSMYKDIQKAYEQIKEAQKTGQTGVGNVVYQAAVELLVPDGQDVDKYMSTLKKYIMDGSSGLTNFINDMVTNNLMDRTGSEVKMKMGVTMEQICETMKITPDMAKAIFNALEMYDFDFDWTEEDYNFNIDTSKIDAEIAELEARIAEITSDTTVELKPGESLESLKKSLDEAYAKKQAMLSGDSTTSGENDITYTVNANTEAADNALESIKSKLDEIAAKIDEISRKVIGNLGADKTNGVLSGVYQLLLKINNFKIADKSFNVYENVVSSSSSNKKSTSSSSSVKAYAEADGTKRANAGLTLVGDEYSSDGSPKPELIITDGAAYVAGQNGPEFVNLKDGDQVVPADKTREILSGNPNARRNMTPAFAAGTKKELFDKLVASGIKDTEAAMSAVTQAATGKITEQEANKIINTVLSGGGDINSLKNPGSGSGSGSGSGYSDSSSSSNEKSQFEKDYEYHQHLLAMEKESYEDYIKWLESAYRDAYNQGQIELEDFYKYEEEVFEGQKELFQDSINDIEHKIKALERVPGNEKQIINYYNQIISNIDKEIAAARARGLNDDDDYIQELLQQKWDYADEVTDIEDEIKENAKDAIDELIDYRMDMLRQDLENEKDAVNDKLDTLKDFYDKQKEMLQDVYDEEKYLEEQSEKRKSVDDIKAEIDMLKFDDSAKAQKRIKELQEELKAAEKDLTDFEKDHALENATDLLDKMYEKQESQMQSEIDAIDAKLNDPNALYNQALRDIQNNTLALYEEMVAYNNKYGSGNPGEIFDMWSEADKALDAYFKTMGESYKNILLVDAYKPTGYASGTSYATPGMHELFEGNKDEYVYTTKDGKRYRMFSGLGDKVLNASATDFLYRFANNGEAFISSMIGNLVGAIGNVGKPAQQIQLSTGDVIVQGNASNETVSAIRRAQRDNIDFVLREFTRLNR